MRDPTINYIINILVLLVFFSIAENTMAQQRLTFEKESFTAALEKSKATHTPIFLMCYASWCTHCNKMKEQVFTDAAVADYYNQHFICVEQDMEKGEGVQLHEKFAIKSYPTFIFFDTNGNIIYRTTGEFKAPEFIAEGMNALTVEKQLPYLQQQFELDVSNADKCYTYLRTLKKGDIDYTDVVKRYFATQSENDLLTQKNWKIIANGTTDIHSREFQYLLTHQKEFAALTSPERVERKIFFLVKELLIPQVYTKDTIHYFIDRQAATDIHQDKIDSLIFMCDIQLYEIMENWNAYEQRTIQSAEKYVWNDYMQLNDIATNYLKHISNQPAFLQAINWVNRSLVLHEEYGTYLMNSKLYQKINDRQDAIQMAKKGKDMALKYGWDYSEADKLLKGSKEIK